MTAYKASQITSYDVYESPDGGRTVYKRKSGSTERVLTIEALAYLDLIQSRALSQSSLRLRL